MKLRIGDFIAAAVVIIIALAIWLLPLSAREKGESITVMRDGDIIYRASLASEREIKLSELTVEIKNGRVSVHNAICPDKLCEKSGEIENTGEIIICVPNRISVRIDGESRFDAVVK